MNILVYGGGAVGLGLAGALIQAGEKVTIIARPDTAEALIKKGLARCGIFGDCQWPSRLFSVATTPPLEAGSVYDFILICTKSYHSKAIAEILAKNPRLLAAQTRLVLCQNGWGNAEEFAARLGSSRLYNARIITGFQRPEKNMVQITVHADAVRIGSLFTRDTEPVVDLCAALTKGGIPCEPTRHIDRDLWAKMLYNCALNPLGAIFQVPYGDLGTSIHTRQIMDAVIREIFAVMAGAGYGTYWAEPEAYIRHFYEKLIPMTARHEASMLQDIRSKKPTEIDALNGAVVRLAERHGIPAPANRQIYHMIRFAEERYLTGALGA